MLKPSCYASNKLHAKSCFVYKSALTDLFCQHSPEFFQYLSFKPGCLSESCCQNTSCW